LKIFRLYWQNLMFALKHMRWVILVIIIQIALKLVDLIVQAVLVHPNV